MLEELRIHDFAIIEKLTVEFNKGFNVITGETGAGKSIIIDAVELLLGQKADKNLVRTGSEKAIVEGVFALNERARAQVIPILMEANLIADESEAHFLTLSRELRNNGRSSCRINGLSCNLEVLAEIGEILVDIHGQSGHLSLLKPRAHMDLLDRYADLLEVRSALTEVVNTLHGLRREIKVLQDDKEALQRKADRLRYEVEDIDAAKLSSNDEAELMLEYNRLANSDKLAQLINEAVGLLSGDDSSDVLPAVDALQQVESALEKLARLDTSMTDDYKLAQEIASNAQELAINLSRYVDDLDHDPNRLNDLEERIELIKKLKRRYNAETVDELLAYANKTRAELEGIEHSEERLIELRALEEKTLRHIGELCERIAKVREVASRALARKVVRELADLRMENAQFEVQRLRHEDPSGAYGKDGKRYRFDATGFEDVEFLLSANVGEPLRPMAKVASGGESARILLALKRVLTAADYTPTLIFDEIDQGIGGRIGAVVGEKLWSLTEGHQVLCVTHLPQLASFGDRHFHVSKTLVAKRTISHIITLEGEEGRVEEIAAMLGAVGESGIQSARDILHEAEGRKSEVVREVQEERKKAF
jgi:DNA repair protein RecN (Recombination protein N)